MEWTRASRAAFGAAGVAAFGQVSAAVAPDAKSEAARHRNTLGRTRPADAVISNPLNGPSLFQSARRNSSNQPILPAALGRWSRRRRRRRRSRARIRCQDHRTVGASLRRRSRRRWRWRRRGRDHRRRNGEVVTGAEQPLPPVLLKCLKRIRLIGSGGVGRSIGRIQNIADLQQDAEAIQPRPWLERIANLGIELLVRENLREAGVVKSAMTSPSKASR